MNWGRIFFGGLVLAAGLILLLGNADVIDSGQVFGTWWPIVLIFAGTLSFFANPRHWGIALIIVGAGVVFLLSRLDVIDLRDLIIPAALIILGLFVIFGRNIGGKQVATDAVNSFNVFSGSSLTTSSQAFKGGSVTAVFGGADIDLREAGLAPDARLDIFAAFGGVDLRVPSDWHVVVRGLPIFGGVDNKAKGPVAENAPTLEVNATVIFGGVDIKRR